ncbi:low affinity immunoglobulin gamma Fc region receptor II-b-like isoform X1 [Solea solea]|uniref:low affinity immunoglobulin gamma Fc region receptor II-b-like isoform X1 n=1 Tax=Solea solea TaxID=90069 RepID=UPI00272BF067|nr:low affinity immunoglobulin gamma Fc region receptor II-b-like isoform X1 [Solea solea]
MEQTLLCVLGLFSLNLLLYCGQAEGSPKLSVSSMWPNHGASVILHCAAEHLSADWRFYWYKLIPNIDEAHFYGYELLPGSTGGTTWDSYVVYNHTNTAGYACRAGRGDPVHYTSYSFRKFVWSREFQSPPSLRVSPDKVQHFRSDSVSLTCEGNSAQWTVVRFRQDGFNSLRCSSFGELTGSTCITQLNHQDAVYWCESKSGQFSSAVNISVSDKDILLESPARPVAEGAAVTLRCKMKTGNFVANVVFYQNDKVVQNDTRWELTIPAVSKSHEGFYRCEETYFLWTQTFTLTSLQSWISVKSWSKPESSPGHLPLIGGLVCGVLVIIPLLLFFCYRKSKVRHLPQTKLSIKVKINSRCTRLFFTVTFVSMKQLEALETLGLDANMMEGRSLTATM